MTQEEDEDQRLSEPLPFEQKRYLQAFQFYIDACAREDVEAIREGELKRAETLPAALGTPISILAVIGTGDNVKQKDGSRKVVLTLPPPS